MSSDSICNAGSKGIIHIEDSFTDVAELRFIATVIGCKEAGSTNSVGLADTHPNKEDISIIKININLILPFQLQSQINFVFIKCSLRDTLYFFS
jgi:hypothetical protein